MPMALALRKAFNRAAGRRTRPMGRPMKMVSPAMAPRSNKVPVDMIHC